MKTESYFQRHPRMAVSLALIAAVLAVVYLGVHLFTKPGRPKSLAYFYNEKTQTLFSDSDQLLPPIDTESGPDTGVRAYVFTCGDSQDPNSRFIAFLEKLTPEGRQVAMATLSADKSSLGLGAALDQHQNSILVRSLKSETWYPKFSPEGLALMKAGKESGGCARPGLCLP